MSANQHEEAIRNNADIGHDRSAIEHRVKHIVEAVGGASLHGVMAGEIIVLLNNIDKKHNALADRLAEAEARAELVRTLVSAAIEMYQWESTTDYPNGDPKVQAAQRRFRDELFTLWDLHYDELDWLDGDLPDPDGGDAS